VLSSRTAPASARRNSVLTFDSTLFILNTQIEHAVDKSFTLSSPGELPHMGSLTNTARMMKINNGSSKISAMEYHGGKKSYRSQDPSPIFKTFRRPKTYDVFLCHHRSDKEQVEIIAARLKDEAGLKPFLDKRLLEPGESWRDEMETALNDSAACAVFLGPLGLGPWQNEPMSSALQERIYNNTLR